MRRCTRAIASNASSTAASMTSCAACATAISTNVPSSGLARRSLSDAVPIRRQNPLHTFGHVMRRQRRTGYVADVLIHLHSAGTALANKLREPARIADLAAIRLSVLQDIHPFDPSRRVQGDGIVDIEML